MVVIKNDYLSEGNKNAPVKVEVFLNLACPYCADFYELADDVLKDYITGNKVYFVVKHYDKPREMLLPGTLINLSLDYSNPAKTLENIKSLFKTQAEWDKLSNHEIKSLLENEYQLKEEPDNIEISLTVTAEAIERSVKMVPTVFINEQEFQFPKEISAAELKDVIEQGLAKEYIQKS